VLKGCYNGGMAISDAYPIEVGPEFSRDYQVHEVEGLDASTTPEKGRIESSLSELESMGFYGDNDVQHALDRKRLSAIDFNNPATKELIARIPGVEFWLALVPTAQALEPLYNPELEVLPNGHVIGPELREWLSNIADAIGIRNRALMLKGLLTAGSESLSPEKVADTRWLSLASGVAQPMLESAAALRTQTGEAPFMTLADLSASALEDAIVYGRDLGLNDRMTIERMNVLRRQGLDVPVKFHELAIDAITRTRKPSVERSLSRNTLTPNSYDVVEAVGILEYLKQHDWQYRYNNVVNIRTVQAGAQRLLENAYRLVREGGDLIVGNMLVDRPQLGFTLNTIQWPHIQPRGIEEMMGMFDEAGLKGERHVYVAAEPSERIYALYRIHKPEAGEG